MPHSGPVLLKSEAHVLWLGSDVFSLNASVLHTPGSDSAFLSLHLLVTASHWPAEFIFELLHQSSIVKWRIYELEAFSFCMWGKWEFLGKGQLGLPSHGTKTSYQTLGRVCNMGYRVFCSINVLLKCKTWKECFSNTWDILGWWRKGIFHSTLFHKTSSLGNKGEKIEKKESVTLSYTASY